MTTNTTVIRGVTVKRDTMTRQHYDLIAAIIRDLHVSGTMSDADAMCVRDMFCDHFADTQSNFKRALFKRACE